MGLLKYAILGTAAVFGLKYLTKKRVADGKSLADDIRTKANQYLNEANNFGERVRHDCRQTSDLY